MWGFGRTSKFYIRLIIKSEIKEKKVIMCGKIIPMQRAYCNTKVERNNRKINNDHYFRIVKLQFCFP